jgi:hypothetical protein
MEFILEFCILDMLLEIAVWHIPPSISCALMWQRDEYRIMHVFILQCNEGYILPETKLDV